MALERIIKDLDSIRTTTRNALVDDLDRETRTKIYADYYRQTYPLILELTEGHIHDEVLRDDIRYMVNRTKKRLEKERRSASNRLEHYAEFFKDIATMVDCFVSDIYNDE